MLGWWSKLDVFHQISGPDQGGKSMKVIQFMRKPNGLAFSIERVFEDVRRSLPQGIEVDVYTNPYISKGIFKRVIGTIRAAFHQGDINHITGDVHFLSLLMCKRRTIVTIHDCVTLERLTGIRYKVFRFFWYWLPAKRAAAITVISSSTKKELLKHLGSGDWSIEIIPDPASPEFESSPRIFGTECPVILQVGTKKNKNIERVAEALRGICCKLVIVGKLTYDQLAVLKKNGIDYESHVGIARSALLELYQNSDILMFCSLYEGFGLPILEAHAIGRPVITSNIYSMPEVAGGAACIVNPYSCEDIRNGVEKIVELNLENDEKINFDKSTKAVKELFDAAKKIDPSL